MATLLIIGFFVLMLLGIPISFAMGASVICSLLFFGWQDSLYILPTQILEGVDKPALVAVPFFILAGNLMNAVGMTDRIFTFATALVGHFRAGLAQVNVLSSMIFAGVSGSSSADMAGLGAVEVKAMRDRGYPPDFAAAITLASGIIGPIIPPSIALVVYAFLSGVSVGRLFLGGVVPGILVGLGLMTYNRLIAVRRGFPREPKASLSQVISSARDGILALIAPVIILTAITTGVTSATEAGVLACVYSLFVGLLLRNLRFALIWKAITDTTIMTGVVMIIVGYSIAMGWVLTIEGIPAQLTSTFLAVTESKHVFIFLTIILVLILGCVIENVPLKLMLVPVLLPIVDQYGVDRVHFGLVLTLAVLMGHATPPMGLGLYILTSVSGVPFERIVIAVAPLLIPLFLVLMLITYIPELVLFLPDLLMGPD
jgi:tripartite ATP-independent transporter DctM subunit